MIQRTGRLASFFLFFAASLPGIILAVIIVHNWVNIPHMDQWGISRVFDSYFERGLPLEDLIEQHNESRKAVPRLIILALGLISKWDVRWEICFTFLLACLLSITFYRHLRKSGILTINQTLAALALLNLFLFSPVQYANWFMGLQLCVFIPPLMLSIGLLINTSQRPLWAKILLVIPCALAGTFSFANGMILWILLIPPDIVSQTSSRPARKTIGLLAAYALCFMITVWIYFSDYIRPAQSYPMVEALLQPGKVFRFFLLWLTTPVPAFENSTLRFIIGGVVLSLFLFLLTASLRRPRRRHLESYPWIIFGLYSMISGFVASMGRLGFGYDMAVSSRYATPALFITIGILTQLVYRLHDPSDNHICGIKRSRRIYGAILIFFILLHVTAFNPALHSIAEWKERLVKGKTALRLMDILPRNPKLACIHTNEEFLKHRFSKIRGFNLLDTTPVDPVTCDFNRYSLPENSTYVGCFDGLKPLKHGRVKVEGWVGVVSDQLIDQAIIFVCLDSNGVSTPVDFITLLSSTPLKNQPYVLSQKDARKFSGVISILPSPDVRTISAWLIDFNSRDMFRLAGEHGLKKRPGRMQSPGATPPAVGGRRRSEM